ncbi:wax ester/triacylglycerol synthase domain-containing protein [Gordonia rhizosphera]|uniref:diacylglycerol O-acyltransferase n=1 Tax=Gordonia rhizosphera NBRC 16068 TaxID=1108045 RepID=K6V8U9_9ACTN|nr:wax ester/triacylglycerol synthase domain-containing protein [Gordonia rhizosphera]GAB92653.1 hypothetical protein GORHZ_186_00230 [Gordonia rhizosphera NBRC 16068]
MERLTGPDALMLNMENAHTPMHTLKVAILDSTRRGRAITVDELVTTLPGYLGLFPRATQRIEWVPGCGARPFWVPDEDFDISAHIDEFTLDAPGGRDVLDALLSELAVRQLDRTRPLWAITLVHGLANGTQAVVVRVHHAVADGVAALNVLMGATAEEGETPVRVAVDPAARAPGSRVLRRALRRDKWRQFTGIPALVRDQVAGLMTTRTVNDAHLHPRPLGARRTSFNSPSADRRVCASGSVPFAALQQVAVATGTTVNGALHGIIAGAMRAEFLARGDDLSRPTVAVFGVAADVASPRTGGNEIATAATYLRTDIEDPVVRVVETAASCSAAVAKRRAIGFELTSSVTGYTGRLGPIFRELMAHHMPRVPNNITTANLPGPRSTRWIGDIEVVDWISFALAIAPADVNLTTYSYAGSMNFGLVATPESMPDPAGFLRRLTAALEEVRAALAADAHAADEAPRVMASQDMT